MISEGRERSLPSWDVCGVCLMNNDTAVTLRLPQDVLDRLTKLAADDGVSRSLLMRRFLLTGIYQREELPSGS